MTFRHFFKTHDFDYGMNEFTVFYSNLRKTLAYEVNPQNARELFVSFAFCAPGESYDKITGREICEKRLEELKNGPREYNPELYFRSSLNIEGERRIENAIERGDLLLTGVKNTLIVPFYLFIDLLKFSGKKNFFGIKMNSILASMDYYDIAKDGFDIVFLPFTKDYFSAIKRIIEEKKN